MNWIKNEMAEQELGDARLNKRLEQLITTLSIEPSMSLPCANDTWAETLAAYRSFDNERVTFDSLMSGHKPCLRRFKRGPWASGINNIYQWQDCLGLDAKTG